MNNWIWPVLFLATLGLAVVYWMTGRSSTKDLDTPKIAEPRAVAVPPPVETPTADPNVGSGGPLTRDMTPKGPPAATRPPSASPPQYTQPQYTQPPPQAGNNNYGYPQPNYAPPPPPPDYGDGNYPQPLPDYGDSIPPPSDDYAPPPPPPPPDDDY
jgi:hypothetical protein